MFDAHPRKDQAEGHRQDDQESPSLQVSAATSRLALM
jgi:hypothetical protein